MPPTDAELRALYDRYGPVLLHRCRGILGDDEDAADAVQETFARVIRHYDRFREEASPLTWMYRISTNLCLNRLRDERGRARKREDHRHEILPEEAHAPNPGRRAEAELVRRLLDEADEQTRQIVTCLYFDDMTRAEAAEVVGISLPTLRKRLNLFLDRSRRRVAGAAAVVALLLIGTPS